MKTDLSGRRLGERYVLEERLDAGGMAEVWRGRDEVLGRDVAVKVLHDELGDDESIFDRFRLEAVAAARLSHPAIVRVFDTGVDDGTCYIVMELVVGRTLAGELDEGRVEIPRAVAIVRRILDALGHAHAIGIVHRDVKPPNVLVDAAGGVKMTDFGIAKAAFGGDLTTTGKLLGTAKYLAPEQVTGATVDGRADLYATGIVLYELVTGRVPFDAETDLATATMRLTSDPPPPSTLRAGIPRTIDEVVMRALARDPEERFQSAEEMSAALGRLDGGIAATPLPPEPEPEHAEPPRRGEHRSFFRSWLMLPVAILAVGVAVAGVGLLLGELELGGPLGVRPSEGNGNGARARELTIEDATDHDPEGDGQEHPETADQAFDGQRETSWKTEGYSSADLGGAKDGVGLVVDLGSARAIRRVVVRTELPGWTFQVKGSSDGARFTTLEDEDGARSFEAGESKTSIRLREVEYRYVLVWVTSLAQESADTFRATLSEVEVFGG